MFENEESYTVQLIVDGFVESGQDIEVFIKSRDGSAIGELNNYNLHTSFID